MFFRGPSSHESDKGAREGEAKFIEASQNLIRDERTGGRRPVSTIFLSVIKPLVEIFIRLGDDIMNGKIRDQLIHIVEDSDIVIGCRML